MKIVPANIELLNQELHALITARDVCYEISDGTEGHNCFGDICYTAEMAAQRLSELLGLLDIEIEDE